MSSVRYVDFDSSEKLPCKRNLEIKLPEQGCVQTVE